MQTTYVAPARERGLKLGLGNTNGALPIGRSREGAWIEMHLAVRKSAN